MHHAQRSAGFTLIELMIVIVVIGILAAIALPAYNDYTMRARRADAKAALMDMAQEAERFYTQNGTYVGHNPSLAQVPADSASKSYNIAHNPLPTQQTFTLTATPINKQLNDACGVLSINQIGAKNASGGPNEDCWAR